ncbi:MAG: NAD(P)H-quinone oxidoreductase [Dehalococcoidia bacterium]
MKAIVVENPTGPQGLVYRDIPSPEPGPEDLLVNVKATALNRADLLQSHGGYPQPGPRPDFEVLGIEFAGEVTATGSRVQGFAPGDRVLGLLPGGGYAEQAVTHQRLAVRVPDRLSWIEAGSLPEVFITAHDALLQAGLVAGESVLIHAAGSGVGVAAIQVARALGAGLLIGTAGSAAKLERAQALGLNVGVNYREEDFAKVVLEATGGRGVDVVIDVIGADYWAANLKALALKGRMTMVGLMSGARVDANLGLLLGKRLQVRGTTLRARPLEEKAAATQLFAKSVIPHIQSGGVNPVIDRTFPLAQAAAALAYMETNANFGKIVLEV